MTALFDSTHSALRFALNYEASTPRPMMNKMAADGQLQRKEVEREGKKIKVTVGGQMRRRANAPLRGLDGAGQAALIAKQLDYLTDPQKNCTIAQYKAWVLPCACKSPCCSGYRKNHGWNRAVEELCIHLRDEAELSRIKGRKGLSTHPTMRRSIVERFFVPGKRMNLTELAEQCGVTSQTIITHKKPIELFLSDTLREATSHLDTILNTLGIVGPLDY